jgi:hypothetical protein
MGGDWSTSRLGRTLLPGLGSSVPMRREAVGLRAGLDTEARGKVLSLCRGSNPGSTVFQSAVRPYTARATPNP